MVLAVPEPCTCTALRQSARHVTRFYDQALASVGIGVNQYAILARLDRIGPRAIGDLARSLVMDRSTLGHLLRPLEQHGLVTLTVPTADRRSRAITLTETGRAKVAEARPLWAAAQRSFDSAFGPASAAQLRGLLAQATEIRLGAPSSSDPAG